MPDICCIGHITSDKIVTPGFTKHMPGGTAWYFSYALSKFDLDYLLVTALGEPEMPYVTQLRSDGIKVKVQPSAHTVYFENIYGDDKDERKQNVLETADTFELKQLADVDASIFHLGPLLSEDITTELIKALAQKGKVSLDVQGYLRRLENHKVYPAQWTGMKDALPHISILKADVAELKSLTGLTDVNDGVKQLADWGVNEVVITNASKGSLIYSDNHYYTIPAYFPQLVVDATGCGDTYMAGYLYQRVKGADLQTAGEFAAAMAGLKTAVVGTFNGKEEDVKTFLKRDI